MTAAVRVNTSRDYDVLIGAGLLKSLGSRVMELGFTRVCVVSDSNVWPLYGQHVLDSLEVAGIAHSHYLIPAGEHSKNPENLLKLLEHLAEHGITRSDCVIALGGGVVGDLSGFAAAIYMRGIPYIQVPTTLLAAVDSSVGGKTAIDLPGGKNLAGAFWQPAMVLCDTDTLASLPRDVFLDGCGEVIKYAVLFDPELFALLENQRTCFDPVDVILRCVRLKRDVVAADEFDRGQRMLLNLGHTFGHAIEVCSNYSVSHGKAVALGIVMAARSSDCMDSQRITGLLKSFDLPTHTDIPADALFDAMLADKKRSADSISLILPERIGKCSICPIPISRLKSMIQDGM